MTDHLKSRAKRYLAVFSRWIALAGGVFAITLSCGLFLTNHVLPKVYAAKAVVEVEPQASPTSGNGDGDLRADFQVIESPALLASVVTDLDLDKAWAERIFKSTDPLSTEDAVTYLKKNLRFNLKRGTRVLEVVAYSDDPRETADIANAVVDHYKTLRDDENVQREKPVALVSESDVPQTKDSSLRPVTILVRAVEPTNPIKPDRRFCYAITLAVAGLLGVMFASSVEVILLFVRAAEGEHS